MTATMKFLHIAAAIAWLGGVSFMLFALRNAAAEQLAPPQRLPLIAQILRRFFVLVWISIGVLLISGLWMMLGVGMKNAPAGWHARAVAMTLDRHQNDVIVRSCN